MLQKLADVCRNFCKLAWASFAECFRVAANHGARHMWVLRHACQGTASFYNFSKVFFQTSAYPNFCKPLQVLQHFIMHVRMA